MIETRRQRQLALAWLTLCAALFVVLAVLVANRVGFVVDLDRDLGAGPFEFTSEHDWARETWLWVGRLTGRIALTVATVITVVALLLKKHHRAAAWTVIVMVAVAILTPAIKLLVGRDRPRWDDPIQTLSDYSFPSGHAASNTAAAGVIIVLTLMLVRRRALRRLLVSAAVVLVAVVVADRLFLGVHNVSDVTAGCLLGVVIVLCGLLVHDPQLRPSALAREPLVEAIPPARRQVAAILNPVKVDDLHGFRAMVERMARESGWDDVAWWETTEEDTGYAMAHEAAVSGADLVLAVGGDGTIRAVCEELAGTGVPVGIVPAGTGNLLARNLAIPLYLRAAVDVALNGQDKAVDMVQVSGDDMDDAVFLVMAGMGFDAAIMEGVNEGFKKRVGWLAYVWSALKALMFPVIRVEISVDGGEFTRHRARTIVIGNVGHLQAGMPLIPEAEIDDGRLDVVLLYPRRFLSWLPVAARVLTKNRRTDESITRMSGREVVVRTATPSPRQLDGDLIPPGTELRAQCIQGRLLVRAPR